MNHFDLYSFCCFIPFISLYLLTLKYLVRYASLFDQTCVFMPHFFYVNRAELSFWTDILNVIAFTTLITIYRVFFYYFFECLIWWPVVPFIIV